MGEGFYMRIFNITSVPVVQNFSSGINKTERQNLPQIPADSFTFKGSDVFPLKEITHKSTEKLFNTDYVPQIPEKKGYYRTFVIDSRTGKYVDLYVRPREFYSKQLDVNTNEMNLILTKDYDFFRIQNGKFKLVGYRTFDIDLTHNIILRGDMETFDKSLKGIGTRGIQLSIEEMKKEGYKDFEALSLFGSYDFNKGNGFKIIDEFADSKETLKSGFIELWQKVLKTDKETIKKMLVYKSSADRSKINLTATLGNFATFVNKNRLKMSDELIIPMRMTKAALKEWLNLDKLKPILR